MPMFTSTTHSICVKVTPKYQAEQSDPGRSHYIFSYEVEIENKADFAVQLVRRHWIILDGNGRSQEVEGEGVVGEKPLLRPGQSYSYTSFCPLNTPTGSMRGAYLMVGPSGEELSVEIPLFILAEPSHYH